jgi:hypothetical protein
MMSLFYSYGIFLTSVVAFPPLFLGFTMAFCRGVNLKCIDAYAVLEWANDTKFHVFATKHKANTYSEQLINSDDCVSIQS